LTILDPLWFIFLTLWCFYILVNYYFQVSFKVIFYVAKITNDIKEHNMAINPNW